MKNICLSEELFFLIATVKTRHVLKRAWQWLSDGVHNGLGHDVMLKKSCFKVLTFQHDPMTLTIVYNNDLKALAMLFEKHVWFLQ